MRNMFIFFAAALLLTACGDGGGSSTPTAEAPKIFLGERAAPGCQILVSRKGGDLGTACQVRIRIVTEAGTPAPVAVTVWSATGVDLPTTLVTAQLESGDTWLATLPVPSPLSNDHAVWVRADMPDGATIEVGREFLLR